MSIEAMKLALCALEAGTDSDLIGNARIALRATIQQAEAQQPDNAACKSVQKRLAAQQPATGEPVQTTPNFTQLMQVLDGLNRCHSRDSKVEFLRSWIQDWTQHKVDKLTRPAPSVPADVVRDAERYRFIRDADVSDDLIPDIALYAMESLDEYIDAAMLAAKTGGAE